MSEPQDATGSYIRDDVLQQQPRLGGRLTSVNTMSKSPATSLLWEEVNRLPLLPVIAETARAGTAISFE